jgi:hypothetical protein
MALRYVLFVSDTEVTVTVFGPLVCHSTQTTRRSLELVVEGPTAQFVVPPLH